MISHELSSIIRHYYCAASLVFIYYYSDNSTFLAVLRAVSPITDWGILPVVLGIKEEDADRIRQDNPFDSEAQIREFIKAWIRTGKASWIKLVSALRCILVNEQGLANQIEKEHLSSKK